MELMRELHQDGLTLVLVTHDPVVGGQAQRLIRMRDGRIVDDGGRSRPGDLSRGDRRCSSCSRSRSSRSSSAGRCCAGSRPATRCGGRSRRCSSSCGSLLGTAIITGSLIVGDTIDRSIRAAAYDQLGPVDEIVSVPLAAGCGAARPLRRLLVARDRRRARRSPPRARRSSSPGAAAGRNPARQLLEVDFADGAALRR